MNKEENN